MSVNLSSSAAGSVRASVTRSNAGDVSVKTSVNKPGASPCIDQRAGAVCPADTSFDALPVHSDRRSLDRSEFRPAEVSVPDMDRRYAELGGVPAPVLLAVPPVTIERYASAAFESVVKLANGIAGAHLDALAKAKALHDEPAVKCIENGSIQFLSTAEETLVDLARSIREKELTSPPTPATQRLLDMASGPVWGRHHDKQNKTDAAHEVQQFSDAATVATSPILEPFRPVGRTSKPGPAPPLGARQTTSIVKAKPGNFAPVHLVRLADMFSTLRQSLLDPPDLTATALVLQPRPTSPRPGRTGGGSILDSQEPSSMHEETSGRPA